MKAAQNGVANVSVLDGWWDEGWTGDNGWAIGGRETDPDEGAQDWADAQDLYRLLEEEIVPRYYERDANGRPDGAGSSVMRRSMATHDLALLDDPDAPRVHRAALPAGGRRRRVRRARPTTPRRHARPAERRTVAPAHLAGAGHPQPPAGRQLRLGLRRGLRAGLPADARGARAPPGRPPRRSTTRGRCSSGSRAERPDVPRPPARARRRAARSRSSAAATTSRSSPRCPERDRIGQLTPDGATSSRRSSAGGRAAPGWPSASGSRTCRPRSSTAGYDWTILDDAHFRAAAIPEEDLWGAVHDRGPGPAARPSSAPSRACATGSRSATSRTSSTTCATTRPRTATRVGMMGDDGEKFGGLADDLGALLGRAAAGSTGSSRRSRRTPTGCPRSRRPRGWTATARSGASTSRPARTPRWASGRCRADESLVFADAAPPRRRPSAGPRRAGCAAAFWRNFQVKYREINDLHKQMLRTSAKVAAMPAGPARDARPRPPVPGPVERLLLARPVRRHLHQPHAPRHVRAPDRGRGPRPTPARGRRRGDGRASGPRHGRPRRGPAGRTPGQVVTIDLDRGRRDRRLGHPGGAPRAAAVLRRRPEAYHETLRAHEAAGGATADGDATATAARRPRSTTSSWPRRPGSPTASATTTTSAAPGLVRFLPARRDAGRLGERRRRPSSATAVDRRLRARRARSRAGSSIRRDGRRSPAASRGPRHQDDHASAAAGSTRRSTSGSTSRTSAPSGRRGRARARVDARRCWAAAATRRPGGTSAARGPRTTGRDGDRRSTRIAPGQRLRRRRRRDDRRRRRPTPGGRRSRPSRTRRRVRARLPGQRLLLSWPLRLEPGARWSATVANAVTSTTDRAEGPGIRQPVACAPRADEVRAAPRVEAPLARADRASATCEDRC